MKRTTRIYASPKDFFEKTGTTQQDFARRAGISQAHLSMIISGKRRPSIGLLFRMSDLMGVPVEVLAGLSKRNILGRTA